MTCKLEGSRVLVTGSGGFLGRHIYRLLQEVVGDGGEVTGTTSSFIHAWTTPHSYDDVSDLREPEDVDDLFRLLGPFDYVFHLAGENGGIAFNASEPARVFHDNTLMALNLMEACASYGVKKVLSVVTSCGYPDAEYFDEDYEVYGWRTKEIMAEKDYLDGPPHPDTACHGYAKRNLQLASYFYNKQHGLNAVCVCPTTLFGPGDCMDPERTKLMGAMVKRFVDAHANGDQKVTCWGSGNPLREFLYIEDCAYLLLQAMKTWDRSDHPLNLGTGQELSVCKLAKLVAKCVGYSGSIKWDTSRPDGQLRKRLDTQLQEAILGPYEFTPLEVGISRTIEWYKGNRK